MRRNKKLASILAVGILALGATACGSDDGDSGSDGGSSGSGGGDAPRPTSRSAWPTTSVAAATSRSTTPRPRVSTRPSTSSASTPRSPRPTDGEAESAREERLRHLRRRRLRPGHRGGLRLRRGVGKVAEHYPDTHFAIIDDSSLADVANVASLVFAEEQGSFLVGAAAALKSEAGHIGFVGGVETPLIAKFQAGYEAGAKAVNPDITIDVDLPQPAAGLLRLR